MDKLNRYRDLVKKHLEELAALFNGSPSAGIETQCVFDPDRDQYLLLSVGWSDHRRIRTTILHVRLRCGKIWVEEDWTEEGIANALVKAGLPRADIVLAFQPPELRHLSEIASA